MMKKAIAMILTVLILLAAFDSSAQEEGKMEPLFATIGDALEEAGENPIAGGEEDYYAVVTEQDGKYYRSVAVTDEQYRELLRATSEADIDRRETAFDAMDEYIKSMPIAYSEEFTTVPMSQAEIDALAGKTIGELLEAGYEERESGTELGENDEIIIVYIMRNGLFEYRCVVNADYERYEKAMEEQPEAVKDFVITSASMEGITREACFKQLHTDGTIEEIPDPFAGFTDLATDVQKMIETAQSGGEVDPDAFFAGLEEKYPDLANMITFYKGMYQMLGAEGLAAMLTDKE